MLKSARSLQWQNPLHSFLQISSRASDFQLLRYGREREAVFEMAGIDKEEGKKKKKIGRYKDKKMLRGKEI